MKLIESFNMFTDNVKGVYFKSGDGGRGCVSFRREKFVPYGGPDGGDGGKGGDIIFVGSRHCNTLVDFKFKKHFRAENGKHGKGSQMDGKSGEDMIVHIPLGTEIIFEGGKIEILNEKPIVFLKGGKGGIGNKKLPTSTNKAPKYSIPEEKGKEVIVNMKLKLIGDVGIVGAPNAGKSSFINSITNANSKVGDYKFTTLYPHLGSYKGKVIFVDIPGLIEGASIGKGLGFEFLAHIERCNFLLLVVDITDDPERTIEVIKNEISTYGIVKEIKICFNKIDLVDKNLLEKIQSKFPNAFFISAHENKGVREVAEYFLSQKLAVENLGKSEEKNSVLEQEKIDPEASVSEE